MKYEVQLFKTIHDTIHIDAETPVEAITEARLKHPGFHADEATELIPDADGELQSGSTFTVITTCENCDAMIFNIEDYEGGEDCDLCLQCAAALRTEASPSSGV